LKASIEPKVIGDQTWKEAQKLTLESIVRITGVLHLIGDEPKTSGEGAASNKTNGTSASGPSYEVDVAKLSVIAIASSDLPPLSGDGQTKPELEERLQNRILDVRNHASGAIFKLHSGMCQMIVEFLCSKGFHWIHTPRIISATISGDNEYFHLPYFGCDSWLAQSTQHHKQMALSMDMERVFEIGPVFRAEVKSKTSARHMTEVSSLAIESFEEAIEKNCLLTI